MFWPVHSSKWKRIPKVQLLWQYLKPKYVSYLPIPIFELVCPLINVAMARLEVAPQISFSNALSRWEATAIAHRVAVGLGEVHTNFGHGGVTQADYFQSFWRKLRESKCYERMVSVQISKVDEHYQARVDFDARRAVCCLLNRQRLLVTD